MNKRSEQQVMKELLVRQNELLANATELTRKEQQELSIIDRKVSILQSFIDAKPTTNKD